MNKILCVEDTPDTRLILESILGSHTLTFASSMKETEEVLNQDTFPLIIMDVDLPDGNALELMAAKPDFFKNSAIIFLTGKKDFATKVTAFSLGADDFILKPFDSNDLRLRVDAKLKKLRTADDLKSVLQIGPLICSHHEQRLYVKATQENISLTSLEFRIFHLLAKTPKKIFSRQEIIEKVWGNADPVTDRAVDVHVSNLRRKIVHTGITIDTTIGVGYRITGVNIH